MAVHRRHHGNNRAMVTGGVLLTLLLIAVWVVTTPQEKLAKTQSAVREAAALVAPPIEPGTAGGATPQEVDARAITKETATHAPPGRTEESTGAESKAAAGAQEELSGAGEGRASESSPEQTTGTADENLSGLLAKGPTDPDSNGEGVSERPPKDGEGAPGGPAAGSGAQQEAATGVAAGEAAAASAGDPEQGGGGEAVRSGEDGSAVPVEKAAPVEEDTKAEEQEAAPAVAADDSSLTLPKDGAPATGESGSEAGDREAAPSSGTNADETRITPQTAGQPEEGGIEPLPATKQASAEVAESAELSAEAEKKIVPQLDSQAQKSAAEKEFETGGSEATGAAAAAAAAGASSTQAAAAPALAAKSYSFPVCGPDMVDYIPCLDNKKAIKALRSTSHYEHRERHCPKPGEAARCLVPPPQGYKLPIPWPKSKDKIWYSNVPHPKLVSYKKDQNWVRQEGDEFVFPGGGTQFKRGAKQYIEFIQEAVPAVAWGRHVRTALDMGCGVASWGAAMFDYNVTVTSMAPKDEHDAQVQFALERGIPALLGVMGTQRQPFPANSFDLVQCSRCRVPWHLDEGRLLIELNRLMRPGGYFVWSATPVYQNSSEDVEIWNQTKDLAARMCWKQVAKRNRDEVGIAVWQKPVTNSCYRARPRGTLPAMCPSDDNPDAAWYVPMRSCIHHVPEDPIVRGGGWPAEGAARLGAQPAWLAGPGIFGRALPGDFASDTRHWYRVFARSYARLGIPWGRVRNVMDASAGYGGFAAAATSARPLWVMNVVPTSAPDTLPIVLERGLLGVYHDWCESFNTYPRTYDLLHVGHLLLRQSKRCDLADVLLEMDRILRPKGWVIVREADELAAPIKAIAAALHWALKVESSERKEAFLVFQKDLWRPAAAAAAARS